MTTKEDIKTPLPDSGLFRELNWCDLIFSQPYQVFRRNAVCFLAIAFFASGLRALLAFIFDAINGPSYGAEYGTDADVSGTDYNLDYNSNQEIDVATFTMNIVDVVIVYVVSCLADGATVHVVSEMYAGKETSASPVAAFGTVAWNGVPLVGSCLLITAVLTVLFYALMPIAFSGRPGGIFLLFSVWMTVAVYISLVTFVTYPVIVVERTGIIASIRRSFQMTSQHLGKILVLLVLYTLFKSTASILVVTMTFSYDVTGSAAAFYIRALLSFCVNAFFMAVRSILKSIIYFDIRITDEQLTQEKLSQEMGLTNSYSEMEDKDIVVVTTDMVQDSTPDTEDPVELAGKEVV